MTTPATMLTSQIDALRDAHERIYRLVRRQSEALSSKDIDALADVSHDLQLAIFDLGQIEVERSLQTASLCEQLDLPGDASLQDIIDRLDEPERSRVTGQALGLRALIGEAQQLAKENEDLIVFEHNFLVSLMSEVLQPQASSADNRQERESRFVDLEA